MDSHYLEKVRNGDTQAFKYFVKKYQGMALSVAVRITSDEEDAKEVVQDAFLKAYTNIGSFKETARFSTWLYKIVYHLALNKKRGKTHRRYQMEDDFAETEAATSTENVLEQLKAEERKKFIQAALNILPENDSLVLTLFYLAENSVEEITEITGWTEANVKTKLHRARKSLYHALEKILRGEITAII